MYADAVCMIFVLFCFDLAMIFPVYTDLAISYITYQNVVIISWPW